MKEKLRFIYVPILLVQFGLLIGYTVFNWLFFIRWDFLSLDEIIPNFFIPVILSGLATWLLLLPRLKILDINSQRLDGKTVSFIITLVVLSVPLIIAQKYLIGASGKLTSLTTPKEIDQFEASKYYTL